jgi:hypothetical protein
MSFPGFADLYAVSDPLGTRPYRGSTDAAGPRSRWRRFVATATAGLLCLGFARSRSVQASAIPPTEAAASSRASVATTDTTRPLLVLALEAVSAAEPRTHALRVTSKVDTLFSLKAADAGWAPSGDRIAYTRSTERGRTQQQACDARGVGRLQLNRGVVRTPNSP